MIKIDQEEDQEVRIGEITVETMTAGGALITNGENQGWFVLPFG